MPVDRQLNVSRQEVIRLLDARATLQKLIDLIMPMPAYAGTIPMIEQTIANIDDIGKLISDYLDAQQA